VTYGAGVDIALRAVDGLDVEVLDLRTVWPLDGDAVLESLAKTSRILVLQEAARSIGAASHVLSLVAREGFELLDAPPALVAPPDTPVPFAPELEDAYIPSAERVRAELEELLAF
jgi:pyruvate dehydrogenase E1 component beta subunit